MIQPRNLLLAILASVAFLNSALGFSPYENFKLSGEPQRVGLIAFLKPDQIEAAKKTVENISASSLNSLQRRGVSDLNIFVRTLDDKSMVLAYFETEQATFEGLTTAFAGAPEIVALEKMLMPHPRAKDGEAWLRMEWMNCLASSKVFPHDSVETQQFGFMSGLKPEKELTYRALHQNNWPGVVDAMVNANYRNWTTFLIELDDKLFLFTTCEYIGSDLETDNGSFHLDPPTTRWWTHTEPCLINLHGEGNWSQMEPLIK